MQFDWWTFAFQVVNVAVLMWLLSHFFFRPVAGIIATRQAETAEILAAAETAKLNAADAQAAALGEKQKNAADRMEILHKARLEAEAQTKAIIAKAHDESARITQQAQASAAMVVEKDRDVQMRKATDLAVVISRRLLGNLPADGRIAGYPERLKQALASLTTEQRNALNADPGALRIVVPRNLSKAESDAIKKTIEAAIKGSPQFEMDVDETMIAGLELKGAHGVIHNSLSHDLERIAAAMVKNEKA